MKVRIDKSVATGKITVPPSKSMAHRYILCAALSEKRSVIKNVSMSEDIKATIDCTKALFAGVSVENDTVTVCGAKDFLMNTERRSKVRFEFNCRESGTTLRLFMGIAIIMGLPAMFTGSGRLMERPLTVYEDLCKKEGIPFSRVKGGIEIGKAEIFSKKEISVPGDISSQFITGIMYGLMLKGLESKIILTGKVESRPYIDMTMKAFSEFGKKALWNGENEIIIGENASCFQEKAEYEVEGDYSNAAFLDAFNYVGGNVTLCGLFNDSPQGDKVYKDIFLKLSKGFTENIDLTDCPDLGPVVFALSSALKGGRFVGTKRLKIKESDRANVMAAELKKFGVEVTVGEDFVRIDNPKLNAPKEVILGHNDHRIVMAASVLLSITGGEIDGAEAVRKSYPDFFEDIKKLGIKVTCE